VRSVGTHHELLHGDLAYRAVVTRETELELELEKAEESA
jgi:hypothetical protein